MSDEKQIITDPSANFGLVIGVVQHNFPPRSGNGPAMLKIKTERYGFGKHASSVFSDYLPLTCWGRQRDACVRIKVGDTVRATFRVGESKGNDDVWRVQITADTLTIFGEGAEGERDGGDANGQRDGGAVPYVDDMADVPFAPCL